jgi:acyl carrier protein
METEKPATVGAIDPELAEVVINSIAAMVGRPAGSLSLDTRLVQDLDFDSTSFMELLLRLEGDLNIEFDPDSFGPSGFETVTSLVLFLSGHLEGR